MEPEKGANLPRKTTFKQLLRWAFSPLAAGMAAARCETREGDIAFNFHRKFETVYF